MAIYQKEGVDVSDKTCVTIKQRQAVIYGVIVNAPSDASYLSVDTDGVITAHSNMPWKEPEFWEGYEICDIGKVCADKRVILDIFNNGPYLVGTTSGIDG
jgi:hypothetical protein